MSTEQWGARTEVATLIGFGLFLVALGGLLAYLDFNSTSDTGGVLLLLGGLSALVGQVLVFIGIVAVGVRLGSRP
ncbi:hypothetical protein L2K70_04640 [Nocardioides KLBMP 9356]|uniref:Uncharacterized protein n=1 Tax=Nocardioides potassii TaxID=2911371 RepID=A0ABS9H6Q4_9ACTN|nr:hypothetical protein [Nocardioides potassii]MCF6376882.1 hypothetical protein [Nocardioides potassii]